MQKPHAAARLLGEALGEDDVKLVELLAAGAAVALQNAYLYQETQRLATTDALTGLSNYRHFHDLLTLEVQRARRMDYPVGLIVMDLDHFKLVNDRHGHPLGDATLRLVAEQLRNCAVNADIVLEPACRDWGPAVAVATALASERDSDL